MAGLTQGLQVGVCEAAQVQVQALQVCEVRQLSGQLGQPTRQAFIAGQVQLTHGGELMEHTTFRDTPWTNCDVPQSAAFYVIPWPC